MNYIEKLQSLTVRVKVKDEKYASSGSGIFFQSSINQDTTFVFVARHTIDGDQFGYNTLATNVLCQFKPTNNSSFVSLKVIQILRSNDDSDLAILVLDEADVIKHCICTPKYSILSKLFTDFKYYFRGYPAILDQSEELIEATIIKAELAEPDNNTFLIRLTDNNIYGTVESTHAKAMLCGFSGSGVFIEANNTIHLVGLVKSLNHEDGVFGTVVCVCINIINSILALNKFKPIVIDEAIIQNPANYAKDTQKYIYRKVRPYANKLSKNQSKEDNIEKKLLQEIMLEENKISILGVGGIGKTSELKKLYHTLKEEHFYPTPLINLKRFHNNTLEEEITRIEPGWKTFPSNRTVVLLDGLDETSNFFPVIEKIESFSEENPDKLIIISCRSNFYSSAYTISGFTPFVMEELTTKEVTDYLYTSLDSCKKTLKHEELESLTYKVGCLTNPFYLERFVQLYCNGSIELNTSAIKILEQLITLSSDYNKKRYNPEIRHLFLKNEKNININLEKVALTMTLMGSTEMIEEHYIELVRDKEIRDLIKLIEYWEEDPIQCGFSHRNFQDYLTAKLIDKLDYEFVKKIIFLSQSVLNPEFLNSISYLVGFHGNTWKRQLLEDLRVKDIENLTQTGIDIIDVENKEFSFRKVLDAYNTWNTFLQKEQVANLHKLILPAGSNNDQLEYIFNNLTVENTSTALYNFLNVLRGFKLNEEQLKNTEDQLLKLVFSKGIREDIIHSAFYTLSALQLNTTANIDKIIVRFRESNHQYIKAGLYYLILSGGHSDYYIDYLLSEVNRYRGSRNQNEESELLDVKWNLKIALGLVITLPGLKKLIKYFIEGDVHHLIEMELLSTKENEEIPLSERLLKFKEDGDLRTLTFELFLAVVLRYKEEKFRELLIFINESNQKNIFYERLIGETTHESLRAIGISYLLDENIIDLISKDYSLGKIDNELINSILACKVTSNDEMKLLLIKEIQEINTDFNYTHYKESDVEEIKQNLISKNINILQDSGIILEKINSIFISSGKDEINFDDFSELIWINNPLSEIVYKILDTLSYNIKGHYRQSIKKVDAENFVKNNQSYTNFQIKEIYELIKNTSFKLDDRSILLIKQWVDEKVLRFKASIDYNNDVEEAGLTWYFTQLLNLEIDQGVLLDFLHFNLNQYNLQDISKLKVQPHEWVSIATHPTSKDFLDILQSKIKKELIIECVVENTKKHLPTETSLERHLDYIDYYQIDRCRNFLVNTIKISEVDQHFINRDLRLKAVDILFKLDKSLLEEELKNIANQNIESYIIRKLVNIKSEVVKALLQNKMKIVTDEKEKLRLAKTLFTFNDEQALEYYTSKIEESCSFIDGMYEAEFINGRYFENLSSVVAIPYLFRLLKISHHAEFKDSKDFNPLYVIINNTLTRLANELSCYDTIIRGYEDLFKERTDLTYLEHQMELLQSAKIQRIGGQLSFAKALKLVNSLIPE
jgi:hypothetical protein